MEGVKVFDATTFHGERSSLLPFSSKRREKNHAYMKELGADHTIDYQDNHIGEATKELFREGVGLISTVPVEKVCSKAW